MTPTHPAKTPDPAHGWGRLGARSGVAALVLALALPLPAQAAVFQSTPLQSALDEARWDDLARVARDMAGPEGVAASALALGNPNERADLDRALDLAESCVLQFPEAPVCHYALGHALAVRAQAGSMLAGLRYLGRIKTALRRALELQPSLFEARSALQMILLVVPGVAGGSVAQARELEAEVRERQPDVARLLRARLAAHDKRWDDAAAELNGIRLGLDAALDQEVLNAWSGVARQWMRKDLHAKARSLFERLVQQLPQQASPVYNLGRVLADEGQHQEALRHYHQALKLPGAANLPLWHRIGVAHMDLGEKALAREALLRCVRDKRANPHNVEDAKKRLKELGA